MTSPKSITILGATGSVGQSTLDLVLRHPAAFRVVALTAQRDVAGLAKAALATSAQMAVIGDETQLSALRMALTGSGIAVAAGADAIAEAAGEGADLTLAAIVGCAGLRPVMRAIARGGAIALANKEALVSAGSVMTQAVARSGATLLPVDSEHNAVFQCLETHNANRIRKITLTASGGPFRTWSLGQMVRVTPEQAVKHPNWSMGAKISVDSATMMNKGLELIEAFHLFPVTANQIDVIVHPQSVIHSMVEYVDGSTLAQLGSPDMRTPIAYCLAWPDRMEAPVATLNLAEIGKLEFESPDYDRFPCLALARQCLTEGGAKPAILNAANEIAVAAFLNRRVAFTAIATIVQSVLDGYDPPSPDSLDDVLAIDNEARQRAVQQMEALPI
ncbi:MAG: 1-deoxy-D-xylulose-5-phosphate reductoisomerase [Chakrabartia sp.]